MLRAPGLRDGVVVAKVNKTDFSLVPIILKIKIILLRQMIPLKVLKINVSVLLKIQVIITMVIMVLNRVMKNLNSKTCTSLINFSRHADNVVRMMLFSKLLLRILIELVQI